MCQLAQERRGPRNCFQDPNLSPSWRWLQAENVPPGFRSIEYRRVERTVSWFCRGTIRNDLR